MKQHKTETTIRELFQKLKRDDERHVPAFTDVLAAARERLEERQSPSRSASRLRGIWRRSLVAAAIVLIASGSIVYHEIHNDVRKGSLVIKERSTAPVGPVKHDSEPTRIAVKPRTRSSLGPRRSNRAKPETSYIPDRINAGVKENEATTNFFSLRDGDDNEHMESGKEKEATTDFIPLRYGDDNEHMESGDVIRVLVPRSAFITLGLPVDVARADEPVVADLLIGEDGLARAIRFVR